MTLNGPLLIDFCISLADQIRIRHGISERVLENSLGVSWGYFSRVARKAVREQESYPNLTLLHLLQIYTRRPDLVLYWGAP